MNSRRQFLCKLAITAGAPLALASRLKAGEEAPPEMLKEDDPVAIAFGYKEDTLKVDQEKYPQHKPEQRCDNCLHYTGEDGKPTGPCTIFPNKHVTAPGWCLVWVIKPEPPKE